MERIFCIWAFHHHLLEIMEEKICHFFGYFLEKACRPRCFFIKMANKPRNSEKIPHTDPLSTSFGADTKSWFKKNVLIFFDKQKIYIKKYTSFIQKIEMMQDSPLRVPPLNNILYPVDPLLTHPWGCPRWRPSRVGGHFLKRRWWRRGGEGRSGWGPAQRRGSGHAHYCTFLFIWT